MRFPSRLEASLAALTGKCGKFPQPPELTDNGAKRRRFGGVGRRLDAGFVIGVSRIRPFPPGTVVSASTIRPSGSTTSLNLCEAITRATSRRHRSLSSLAPQGVSFQDNSRPSFSILAEDEKTAERILREGLSPPGHSYQWRGPRSK